jgi:hypothetical protein
LAARRPMWQGGVPRKGRRCCSRRGERESGGGEGGAAGRGAAGGASERGRLRPPAAMQRRGKAEGARPAPRRKMRCIVTYVD